MCSLKSLHKCHIYYYHAASLNDNDGRQLVVYEREILQGILMEIVVRFAYSVVKKWLSLQGFQKKIWPNLFSTRRPGVVSIKFKAKWLCIVLAYWLAVINVICVLCIIVDEYPMFVCKKNP